MMPLTKIFKTGHQLYLTIREQFIARKATTYARTVSAFFGCHHDHVCMVLWMNLSLTERPILQNVNIKLLVPVRGFQTGSCFKFTHHKVCTSSQQ